MKKIIFLILLLILGFYLFNKYKSFYGIGVSEQKINSTLIEQENSMPLQIPEPKTDKGYLTRGNTKFKNKDYKAAIEDYTKAIELNKNFAQAFQSRGLAKDKINDFIGAKKDYEKAIEIKSSLNKKRNQAAYRDLKIRISQAEKKILLKDYENAMKDYNLAVEMYPQYPDGYVSRGDLKYILKDYNGALFDYDKALVMSSNFELYYKRGNAKYNLNDYKNAVKDYKMSINLNGNYEKTYYKLSGALIFCEKFEEASSMLRRFMEKTQTPYIYAGDFYSWNNILNKYHNNNSFIRDIKNDIKKLKVLG